MTSTKRAAFAYLSLRPRTQQSRKNGRAVVHLSTAKRYVVPSDPCFHHAEHFLSPRNESLFSAKADSLCLRTWQSCTTNVVRQACGVMILANGFQRQSLRKYKCLSSLRRLVHSSSIFGTTRNSKVQSQLQVNQFTFLTIRSLFEVYLNRHNQFGSLNTPNFSTTSPITA
jgi:hypothetical protein